MVLSKKRSKSLSLKVLALTKHSLAELINLNYCIRKCKIDFFCCLSITYFSQIISLSQGYLYGSIASSTYLFIPIEMNSPQKQLRSCKVCQKTLSVQFY